MIPPAYQRVAHPFGMLEYTKTFLSHTVLTNALGFTQRRYANGELVETSAHSIEPPSRLS
jgi:hypothetical protein